MTRLMLIDASQSEETRVVVLHGNRLEEFDYDSESKKQLKGNVYLAKVTRVEPSLQAAFVEYGGNRHGFLAFNEIHPDYYKIPVADREQLLADEAAEVESDESDQDENVETVGGDELEEVDRRRRRQRRHYKIQEVTKRGQVLLVQVVKEERGNKGAALTTYLSLPGRYCVLMPNTGRGGGISRKISNARDRKRLKTIVDDLGIPKGMAVIVRTAGSERTKAELKRDFEYLMRLWTQIRDDTLKSSAPSLIYEEANLIKRAIRDMYTKDIDDVLVEGDEGYKTAKGFMRTLMPSHAKRVQPYKSDGVPVFQRYQVEGQIDAIHNPEVKLRSGGYIVMHQTEALVAIDVNSGRATRERHIEETALKTNMEAAEEVARQLRLRDLAGLIVIDFIDMEESRNNHAVERKMKDALRFDRARIQVGRISHFGLLEMSRQRMRPSLMEISSEICHYCGGSGYIQSVEWSGLHVLRAIEEEALRRRAVEISVTMPADAALYLLNHKRAKLNELETRYELKILIVADSTMIAPNFNLDLVRTPGSTGGERSAPASERVERAEDGAQERPGRRRRRGRRRRPQDEDATVEMAEEAESDEVEETEAVAAPDSEEESEPRRRKRGRRGGRRRGRRGKGAAESGATGDATQDGTQENALETAEHGEDGDPDRADTYRSADSAESDGDKAEPALEATADADAIAEDDTQAEEKPKPARKRPRRRRKPAAAAAADAVSADVEESAQDAAEDSTEVANEDQPAQAEEAPLPMVASEKVNGTEFDNKVEPAPIELPEESVVVIPAEEISATENGANGNDESSDKTSDAEPSAVTAERQASKKSGWWNRNW